MAYYDPIAKQWHRATGYKGGAFKRLALNDVLLSRIPGIGECSILELGAGNGYFLPLMLRRFSGQVPSRCVITDLSRRLLDIAQKHFKIVDAEYRILDVRRPFPFHDDCFDLVLASMVFNEVSTRGLERALEECHRVLAGEGLVLVAVTHPAFVESLRKRGLLKQTGRGGLTMPGSGNLRLPVVVRSSETYRRILTKSGFSFKEEDVFPTTEVLNAKPGLRKAGGVPLAQVFECTKSAAL